MARTTFDWRAELVKAMPQLRSYARSLSRNHADADDLVQETVLKAWSHREQFQIGTNLRCWLMTILRNSFYSKCRRKHREVEDIDGEYAGALTVLPSQEWSLSLRELDRSIGQLSPDQREVLTLVVGSGMTYMEVAEICGCAIGTIKSRLARARAQLATNLDQRPARQTARRPHVAGTLDHATQ